jgi:hypothetical protein
MYYNLNIKRGKYMKTVTQLFNPNALEYDIIPARMDHDVGPSVGGPVHEMLLRQREMLKSMRG